MTLSKQEREELRLMFGGFCAYCGVELARNWQVDHVEPVVRYTKYEYIPGESFKRKPVQCLDKPENDCKENLWPVCHQCNINKSSMPLEVWRKFLLKGPESLASYNGRFKHMMRFGIVIVNPEPFKFWYEKYRAQQENL